MEYVGRGAANDKPQRDMPRRDMRQRRPGADPSPAPLVATPASLLQLQRALGNQAVIQLVRAHFGGGAVGPVSPSTLLQRETVKGAGQPTEVAIDDTLPPELIQRVQPGMGRAQLEGILQEYRPHMVLFEIGAVFNAAGLVKRVQKGTAGSNPGAATVNMTALTSGLSAQDRTDMVLTHSHPKGYPLSAGDAGQAAKHNMAEVHAVGLTTTSLRRRGDKWVDTSKDPTAWLNVQSTFDTFRKQWPGECAKRLSRNQTKAQVVDTDVPTLAGTWLDLTTPGDKTVSSPSSLLATY